MPIWNELKQPEFQEPINRAVGEAESHTSAELLPVVAQASGRYDRAEDLVGLWLAAILVAGVYFLFPEATENSGDWGASSVHWKLVALLACLPIGFLVGAGLASRVTLLRKLFTPSIQMREEVYAKARMVFFDQRVHHTAGGSGVLLYVSLYERMAAVIADENAFEALGQARIDQLCQDFTAQLRSKGLSAAYTETLAELGPLLGEKLPRPESDQNELSDALILID